MNFVHNPDYAFHPGETLAEALDDLGMTISCLAGRSDLSAHWLDGLVRGEHAVTPAAATALEAALNIPAGFWMRYQTNFDHHTARAALQP